MTNKPTGSSILTSSGILMPQEEMLEVALERQSLNIGIPRETTLQENRVALDPDAVARLVANGHNIIVETNAGKGANFQDKDYSDAGAKISYDSEEVFKCDMVIKVDPPTNKEIEMMQANSTLISALQISTQPKDFLNRIMKQRINAVAFDFIQDKEGIYPFVRSMSEIAGNTAVLIAAEYLSNVNNGKGLMMGGALGVPPTEVVIVGAGTVGEFAARAAIGLGATVKVFDDSIHKLSRLQNNLGQRVYTSTIHPDILFQAMRTADVAIGAVRSRKGRAPVLVSEQMVSDMKFGSVVVDVCIDQGGCFETSRVTSHEKPTFTEYGVVHYCVPNIASRVAQTASVALSNIFSPLMLQMSEMGGIENMVRYNEGFRKGVYVYNGSVTNEHLAKTFNLPYKDLDLVMAASLRKGN